MSRNISLIILAVLVIVLGISFFGVIRPFIFPLFFAAVLAIIFRPFYLWVTRLCRGRARIAAALTTVFFLLVIMLPLIGGLLLAGRELVTATTQVLEEMTPEQNSELLRQAAEIEEQLTPQEREELRLKIRQGTPLTEALELDPDSPARQALEEISEQFSAEQIEAVFGRRTGIARLTKAWEDWLRGWLAALGWEVTPAQFAEMRQTAMRGLSGWTREIYDRTFALVKNVVTFVIGLVITCVSLYYFLADGPLILQAIRDVSPLEDEDEVVLFTQFDRVCRGVVLATFLSAIAQAILAGIGFVIVGMERVWLLCMLTMFFAIIPFLGAATVWIAVAILLFLQQQYWQAIFVTVYGAAIVSTVDNVIKMYILHGQSGLHPLVALVTVLGAISVIGLWGVFVGPIVAAFFYALLKIFKDRLHGRVGAESEPASDAEPATDTVAEEA